MRYTARQQHCMQAMGVVPWVSRLPEDAAALLAAASSPATSEAGETALTDAVPAGTGKPEADMSEPTNRVQTVAAPGPAPVEPPESRAEPEVAGGEQVPAAPHPSPVESPRHVDAEQAAPDMTVAAGGNPPAAIESLGQWLLQQRLAPIEFRGGLHPVLGVADAPILVVLAQDAPSPAAGSMAGDDGRLFELMLRSIALSNRDTRRCQLGSHVGSATAGADDAHLQAGVGGLCSASTRGVLVLMDPWSFDVGDTAVEQHQSRLPESGLPVWRIAHPAIVLEQPQLKRQAWQVLKRLRATLDGTAL